MLYLHLIGASSRMQEFYVPLLITLRKEYKFEIKTIFNRTIYKAFLLKEKLCEGEIINNFDLIKPVTNSKNIAIISLTNSQNYKYAKKLLKLNFNLFIDTPIARKIYQARELISTAEKRELLIFPGEERPFTDEISNCINFVKKENFNCTVVNESYGSSYHAFAIASALGKGHNLLNLKKFKGNILKTKYTTEFIENYKFSSGLEYIIKDYIPKKHPVRTVGRLLGINQDKFTIFADANIGKRDNPKPFQPKENTRSLKFEGLNKNIMTFLEAVENNNNKEIYYAKSSINDLYFSKFQTLSRRLKYIIHYKILFFIINVLSFLKLV